MHFSWIFDGVMFDFEKHALEVTGFTMDEVNVSKEAKRKFWGAINAHIKAGHKFFEELELMDDAPVLWEYLLNTGLTLHICSATGNTTNAEGEKRAAVRRHFGDKYADEAHLVRHSQDKAQYATPTTILIDDRLKSINPWVEAGGIGILHISAVDTIRQLKEMGI